ncbi:hypothetical protein HBB16_05525 [Pseudonocardia sp. MCCB 268]|nr:hypothetical protein [Pseudonocardia cytotoxica]
MTLLRVLSAVLLRDATDDDQVEGLAAAEQVCALEQAGGRAPAAGPAPVSGWAGTPRAVEAGTGSVTLAPDDAGAAAGYARVLQRSSRLRRAPGRAPGRRAGTAAGRPRTLLADVASDLGQRHSSPGTPTPRRCASMGTPRPGTISSSTPTGGTARGRCTG